MAYESEALADELERLISDTIDQDWQPRWAADAVLPLLREAHHDRDRYQREAAYWREQCEALAEALQFIFDNADNAQIVAQKALANHTAALIDGGEA